MKIMIDNGHGSNTAGKCSPDKRLREYAYAREIARRVVDQLKARGYDAELLTPETTDVSLSQRVARVNRNVDRLGRANCMVVSVHCDASGKDGQWHDANGWSVHVALKASKESHLMANCLLAEAKKAGIMGNRFIPAAGYWPQDLAICRDTKCPAILTENMFMDNRHDVDFLLSEQGKATITRVHVDGIIEYIKKMK